jgi:glycosyltransferase involved in cell wall biosynthesis
VSVLNLIDRVAVPSGHSAAVLASLGVAPSRISIVPYGVRTEGAEPDERDARTLHEMTRLRRQGALVVVCIGTFGTRKNQALLVDALALVEDQSIFCVFVGDGEEQALHAAIERTGTGDRVRVHGYSRAARRIGAAADLFVLPSRSEGQPVAVLEAFCDGTLVAVSNIPELTELVDDGVTGFCFPSVDARSLANTLAEVAALPNSTRRAIRERARSRYASRFTVAAMVAGYGALYQGLATARRSDGSRPQTPAA